MEKIRRALRVGLIGIGGFGTRHLEAVRHWEREGICRLDAVCIRSPQKYEKEEEELRKSGVRIHREFGQMLLDERGKLDLIGIPSGIDQHETQSIAALNGGFHVLCEKPAAGTAAEVARMREAQISSGKILAIGYQNIFSPTIQRIKEISVNNKLGSLVSANTAVQWPRASHYYNRNSWAGKLKVNGRYIYDSPAQNATAHFLQNMLYVAGTGSNESAEIGKLYGENYRAKQIESADTQFLRITTCEGSVLNFATTHSCPDAINPQTVFYFEGGKVIWRLEKNGVAEIYRKTGRDYSLSEEIRNEEIPIQYMTYLNVCQAISAGKNPLCTIHNSYQQTQCIETLFSGGIVQIDQADIETLPYSTVENCGEVQDSTLVVIRGISELYPVMLEEGLSFHESGASWASRGREFNL